MCGYTSPYSQEKIWPSVLIQFGLIIFQYNYLAFPIKQMKRTPITTRTPNSRLWLASLHDFDKWIGHFFLGGVASVTFQAQMGVFISKLLLSKAIPVVTGKFEKIDAVYCALTSLTSAFIRTSSSPKLILYPRKYVSHPRSDSWKTDRGDWCDTRGMYVNVSNNLHSQMKMESEWITDHTMYMCDVKQAAVAFSHFNS